MLKKIIPLITIFIVAILSLLILRPTLAKTIKVKKENKKEKLLLLKLNKKLSKLESIDEQEVEKRAKSIEGILPSSKPILNLIASLEGLSLEEEVVFSGLELKPGIIEEVKKRTDSKTQFEISFGIEGNLANITSFVSKLEKTTPLMKIKKMDLKLEEKEKQGAIRASFSVEVFYQPLPKTLGKVDSPLPVLTTEEVKVLKTINSYRFYPLIKPNAPVGKENLFTLLED